MITKISSLGIQKTARKADFSNTKTNNSQNHQNQTELMSASTAHALKSLSNVSFKGETELTPLEKSFINDIEIRIPNLLDLKEDIRMPFEQMPKDKEKLNLAGINVHIKETPYSKMYVIKNDLGNIVFEGEVSKNMENKPELIYKQGKYMPEITIKDESLGGGRIKMYSGSQVKGRDFNFVMPGRYTPNPSREYTESISFTGNVAITTLNKEKNTRNAVESYINAGLAHDAIRGDYADIVAQNNPTFVVPAGGFGERFYNIPRDKENKPSAKLPTTDNYRVMGTALNLIASTGLLSGDETDNIVYLSQNNEIDGENVYHMQRFTTDGGAIAEGLVKDIISDDKDMVILNADIFTNADITHAYKALKTLPNAALVIPYYPVGPQRAKSFGLMATQKDENGNLVVEKFIEKPQYTTPPKGDDFIGSEHGDYTNATSEYLEVKKAKLPNEDKFMSNPGLYFISKEAVKVLMAMGILNTGYKKDENGNLKLYSETGLGKHVMPKIVELANNGLLMDNEGNKLKVYTLPLEAKGENRPAVWDDIGTAAAYLSLIKDVASQTQDNGTGVENKYYGVPEFLLRDFERNVDLNTGIVYSHPEARDALDNFKNKYSVEVSKGNIFVTLD